MNPQPLIAAADHPLLDPPTRAVLVMALLAFVVLGVGLTAGVMLGGRWARRYGGDDLNEPLALSKPPRDGHDEDDDAVTDGAPRQAKPGETLADPFDPGETRAE